MRLCSVTPGVKVGSKHFHCSSLNLSVLTIRYTFSTHHPDQSCCSLPRCTNNKDSVILSSIGPFFKYKILANPRMALFSKLLKEYILRANEVNAYFLHKGVTILLLKGNLCDGFVP